MSGVPLRVTAGALLVTSLLGSAVSEPGDLDPAFGEGGLAPPTGIRIDATAVAQRADGKLVVVGAYDSIPHNYPDFLSDDYDFIVARLNTDGTIVTDFGIGGAAIEDSNQRAVELDDNVAATTAPYFCGHSGIGGCRRGA